MHSKLYIFFYQLLQVGVRTNRFYSTGAYQTKNGVVKYEVVYLEMKDPLVNNSGTAVATSITLRNSISKPMLGPMADGSRITTDRNYYEITTDGGLSFSISGSKVRYANQLSADLGTFTTLYPNAIENMRSQMKSLGQKEWVHLPLWMRTAQTSDLHQLLPGMRRRLGSLAGRR